MSILGIKKPMLGGERQAREADQQFQRPAQPEASQTYYKNEAAHASGAHEVSIERGMSGMSPSIIGQDLSVTGNVVSKGEIQIDGEVQGDIHSQTLIVGEKAVITGGIVAEEVTVRGKVLGSVRANRVTLQSTSHVEGDVFHQSLAIEQGAFFEGKSRRADEPMKVDAATAGRAPMQLSTNGNGTQVAGSGARTAPAPSGNGASATR